MTPLNIANGPAVAPNASQRVPRGRVSRVLGRRWPEALAWGACAFLGAGIPGIYGWIVVSAACIDWLHSRMAGAPVRQDWSALGEHLPIGVVIGIVSWTVAAVVCVLIARTRRLRATPMFAIGWIAFAAPFTLWLALLQPSG